MMKKKHTRLLTLVALSLFVSNAWAGSDAKPRMIFHGERGSGKVDRVEVRLEVGGEAKFAEKGTTQNEKMSILCELDYVEKMLPAAGRSDSENAKNPLRSVRDYQNISVDVKVGGGQYKPALAPEHRRIAAEAAEPALTLFSPDGNLTRDELDAIDVQGDSLLLDRLLPEKAVAIGDRWAHSGDLMAALLRLDQVAKTTVESSLIETTGSLARFEIAGRVEGAVDGVSTVIEVKGRYRFDLRAKRIDWLGLLIKEVREISFVSDGLDVVSRLSVKITPAECPAELSDDAVAKLEREGKLKCSPESVFLTYESAGGQWRCALDRRWNVNHQRPKIDAAVLRLIDRGEFAGQCNLSSLPQRDPKNLVSLEDFQKDVQKALGKDFGEFVEAAQTSNDANYRLYRVAIDGQSASIPMRWVYYLVADSDGRQAALTFTVEQKNLERFAEADRTLVESLRFEKKD
jgi:hypothetical protein